MDSAEAGRIPDVADVVIWAQSTLRVVMATTNEDGIYTISGLPLGTYVVRPTRRGTSFGPAFKAVRLTTADIAAGNMNFEPQIADTVAPSVQVREPLLAGRFIAGALRDIVVAGSAQDNRGGAGLVQVSVAVGRFDKDNDAAPLTFLNWSKAASVPTFIGYRALLNEKLAEGTATWRLKEATAQILLSQLPAGSYGVRASALDAAGNIGFSPWKRFTVSAAP